MVGGQLVQGTMPSQASRRSRTAYLLMLSSSVLFACMTMCTHGLGERADWRISVVARAGVVFVMSAAVAKAWGVRLLVRYPRTLWVRSVSGSISMLLTFYALTHMPPSLAVTLTHTYPMWVTLLAWPLLQERPTGAVAIALLSGIAGVAFIKWQPITAAELEHFPAVKAAGFAALGAAICTAVSMLGLHRLRHVQSMVIVVHFSAFATVACVVYTIVTILNGDPLPLSSVIDPINVLLMLSIGVFATAGQIAMTKAFTLAPPQRLAVVGLSQVLFALILELSLLDHPIGWRMLLGMSLVVAPVAWLMSCHRGQHVPDEITE